MILVDTNVVSEILKPVPSAPVLAWWNDQEPRELWVSVMTAAELRLGVGLLPAGKRKQRLAATVERVIDEVFAGRLVVIDDGVATQYAAAAVRATRAGRPISVPDALIAASALRHGAVVATRNSGDFEGTGVPIVNPWEHASP